MFSGVTKYANSVDSTLLYIIAISLIIFVGVIAVMLFFVWKYSKKKNPVASQIHGNTTVEIVWTVIPTILVITMFFAGYTDFKALRNTKTQDLSVLVVAKSWKWEFYYNDNLMTDTLFVPVNKTIKLNITSGNKDKDYKPSEQESKYIYLHSMYIPAMRIKEDAVPGRYNFIFMTPIKVGSYDIACTEYCGLNHSAMYTKLVVMEQKDYDEWFNKKNPKNITSK